MHEPIGIQYINNTDSVYIKKHDKITNNFKITIA